MTELGELQRLMPKPGDSVVLGGTVFSFAPLAAAQVGKNGGIQLPPRSMLSMIAATVIEVAEPGCYKVRAPFSPAGRLQLVLNGIPIDHRQVIELEHGRYPLLVVLRLTTSWTSVEPWFDPASAEEIALAKRLGRDRERRLAERAVLTTSPRRQLDELIRRADQLRPEERKRMFWLPDRELAEAWLTLHELGSTDLWSR